MERRLVIVLAVVLTVTLLLCAFIYIPGFATAWCTLIVALHVRLALRAAWWKNTAAVSIAALYVLLVTRETPSARFAGDTLFLAVIFLGSGGGRWLRRMKKKLQSSLTAVGEAAFRREVAQTR
jgi:hypothetical protein